MSHAADSKSAAAYLIDPMNAPEPSAETGPGTHFGSTFAPAQKTTKPSTPPRESLSSNNPFRSSSDAKRSPATPPSKGGASSSERPLHARGSPKQPFPNHRAEAFGDYEPASRVRSGSNGNAAPPSYEHATSPNSRHRRTSSLKERFPGDKSHEPLNIIRKDSRKAHRSPHLKKHHQPGPDTVDKLDPAIGGRAYHHEGPYDAALLARNTSFENSPVAALQTSNEEALKATPAENIKDAVERHKPLDGVAIVPPGMPDRFGRTYEYEEGADLLHEDGPEGPGLKRWANKDYSPDDLKGQSEPSYSLDRAFQAHKIDENGIEMSSGSQLRHEYNAAKRNGSLDTRDPVDIAGGHSKYVDVELANTHDSEFNRRHSGGLRDGLKKRIGSLRKKNRDD